MAEIEPIEPTIELEHAIGFHGIPSSIYLHPNGQQYLYLSGACVVVASLTDSHDQIFLRGHDDDVTTLSLSPTGRFITSGQRGINSDVCVWDHDSGSLLYRMEEHDEGVSCVRMSHDEKLLMTVGTNADKKLVIWDMSCGYIVAVQYLPISEPVNNFDAAWGGKVRDVKRRETDCYQFAVVGGQNLVCYILDPFSGQLTHEKVVTASHVRNYTCIEYSPDGDVLFVGSDSGDVGLYSTRQHVLMASTFICTGGVRSLLCVHNALQNKEEDTGFRYARFGGQDRTLSLYVGGGDGSIVNYLIRDPDKPVLDERSRLHVQGDASSISLSPDREFLMVGTAMGHMYKVHPKSEQVSIVSESALSSISSIRFHPFINDRFATTSGDGFCRVWDISSYKIISKATAQANRHPGFKGASNPFQKTGESEVPTINSPNCMAYIGQMDVMLTGWSDGCIRSFDATNGEFLWSIDNSHRSAVTAIVVAPNLKFFVTGGMEGEVRLWEMKTRELVTELKEHHGQITSLKLFEDSSHLISSSKDKSVLCWDLMKERRVASYEQRMGAILSLDLYRNQTNFVTVGQEKKLSIWDTRKQQPVISLPACGSGNNDCHGTVVSISHDNRFLATGGTDQVVRLWDANSARMLERGVGHSAVVNDVQWSPDDKQLVSVGADACAMLWNVYC